jgi:hypothetical protein
MKYPLRKIVRREKQDGNDAVLLVCGHSALGRPESRYSVFFPCPLCQQAVDAVRRTRGSSGA